MKIQVTQEDIDNGIPEELDCCPIALALERTLGKNNCYEVIPNFEPDKGIIMIHENDTECRQLSLPKEANEFACAFDRLDKVKPFEFELA